MWAVMLQGRAEGEQCKLSKLDKGLDAATHSLSANTLAQGTTNC